MRIFKSDLLFVGGYLNQPPPDAQHDEFSDEEYNIIGDGNNNYNMKEQDGNKSEEEEIDKSFWDLPMVDKMPNSDGKEETPTITSPVCAITPMEPQEPPTAETSTVIHRKPIRVSQITKVTKLDTRKKGVNNGSNKGRKNKGNNWSRKRKPKQQQQLALHVTKNKKENDRNEQNEQDEQDHLDIGDNERGHEPEVQVAESSPAAEDTEEDPLAVAVANVVSVAEARVAALERELAAEEEAVHRAVAAHFVAVRVERRAALARDLGAVTWSAGVERVHGWPFGGGGGGGGQ